MKAEESGPPATVDEKVELVRQKLLRSLKMSMRKTILETMILPTTAWLVPRKRFKRWKLEAIKLKI